MIPVLPRIVLGFMGGDTASTAQVFRILMLTLGAALWATRASPDGGQPR